MKLFEFDSVSIAFEGRPVLENFSLAIAEGDKVIFRGPSGSGKSTLLRLLLGFVRPDAGEFRFRGEPLTAERAWALRKETAYVNQHPGFDTGTVKQVLENLFHLGATPRMPEEGALDEVLASVDLDHASLGQQIADLSGGERQRIALAAALLLDRSVFLLDEPTAALDAVLKARIAGHFLQDRPAWTVIAAAHDEAWFDGRADVHLINLPEQSESP